MYNSESILSKLTNQLHTKINKLKIIIVHNKGRGIISPECSRIIWYIWRKNIGITIIPIKQTITSMN